MCHQTCCPLVPIYRTLRASFCCAFPSITMCVFHQLTDVCVWRLMMCCIWRFGCKNSNWQFFVARGCNLVFPTYFRFLATEPTIVHNLIPALQVGVFVWLLILLQHWYLNEVITMLGRDRKKSTQKYLNFSTPSYCVHWCLFVRWFCCGRRVTSPKHDNEWCIFYALLFERYEEI